MGIESATNTMFTGMAGVPMFYGVVEDRNDPMKLGRVRVRIYGIHSESNKPDDFTGSGIAVEDLPWAYPILPITSTGMNGIGETPLGPVEGTNVVGFSRDGKFMNDLVILGVIGGVPGESSKNKQASGVGFFDPNEQYPREDYLDEPDTNRLARGEKIDETIVQQKTDGEKKGIPNANGTGTWDEKPNTYDAEYPFNHVKESESGHISEVDDTPGAERLHTYHRTGTFEEIGPDGSKMTKVVKDDYTIILGDNKVNIVGRCDVHIEGDASLYVKGNVEEQVDGNVNSVVGKNLSVNVADDTTVVTGGNTSITTEGNTSISAGGDTSINTSGNTSINSDGTTNVTSGGKISIQGDNVSINGGSGVITGESICHLTGLPHADKSSQVTCGK